MITPKPVTKAHPCAVCRGDHKCSRKDDGLILCGREAGDVDGFARLGPAKGDPTFTLYRHRDDAPRPTGATAQKPAGPDWLSIAKQYADRFDAAARDGLARAVGLPADAFAALPLIGWNPDDEHGPCWLFPEVDASNRVTGINRRFVRPVSIAGGKPTGKALVRGGNRGLIVPTGWRDHAGPVLLPEGASDTLALTHCGLTAIGRPSDRAGVDALAALLVGIDRGREILVVGERDEKPDGKWPGKDGAVFVAERLAAKLRRPVRWTMPPEGIKDSRAWVLDLVGGSGEAVDWPAIRKTIAAGYLAAAEPRAVSKWPEPVPVTMLPDSGPPVDWLWHGCIARGHVTLFSALMKAGKTTLVAHMLRTLQTGGVFLGRATKPCRTLVVSEESATIWRGRRDALGLDDHLHLMCRPMLVRPSFADWIEFLAHVKRTAAGRFDLIAFDTIAAFAPWQSENDSAEVMGTVTPLNQLTEAGHAVMLFHHHGKADQSEGRAARGSTALAGSVDVMLEMRRFKPDDVDDRRRVLNGLGRFDEIPTELVIALADDGSGYTAEGDRKAVAAREVRDAIQSVLPADAPGSTADDVHAAMPEETRPRRGDVMKALRVGADEGVWQSSGTGKRNDPRRFWRGLF